MAACGLFHAGGELLSLRELAVDNGTHTIRRLMYHRVSRYGGSRYGRIRKHLLFNLNYGYLAFCDLKILILCKLSTVVYDDVLDDEQSLRGHLEVFF